jgi:hypothetical protein
LFGRQEPSRAFLEYFHGRGEECELAFEDGQRSTTPAADADESEVSICLRTVRRCIAGDNGALQISKIERPQVKEGEIPYMRVHATLGSHRLVLYHAYAPEWRSIGLVTLMRLDGRSFDDLLHGRCHPPRQ